MTRNEPGQGWGVGQSIAFQAKETACTNPPKCNASQSVEMLEGLIKGQCCPRSGREGESVWPEGSRVEAHDPVTAICGSHPGLGVEMARTMAMTVRLESK